MISLGLPLPLSCMKHQYSIFESLIPAVIAIVVAQVVLPQLRNNTKSYSLRVVRVLVREVSGDPGNEIKVICSNFRHVWPLPI